MNSGQMLLKVHLTCSESEKLTKSTKSKKLAKSLKPKLALNDRICCFQLVTSRFSSCAYKQKTIKAVLQTSKRLKRRCVWVVILTSSCVYYIFHETVYFLIWWCHFFSKI